MSGCNCEDSTCLEGYENLELKELINEIPLDNSLNEMSEILKAISDPLRLKILYLLKNGELCGCHITSALDKPQSTISHHLVILKKSKLVNWRKEGTWIHFSLANPKLIEQIEDIAGRKDELNDDNQCCCGESEEVVGEENGCGCGSFKVTDYSKIQNPQNPKNKVNDSLLKELEEKSKKLGIVSIGYSKIPQDIFNKNNTLNYSNAIVLTYPIGMDIINEIPSDKAQIFNNYLYAKFGDITYTLSDYLRKEGYETQVAHPMEGLIDLAKLGQETGLGYIGKSGLLISPELGPRLKVSAILTTIENLPFSEENSHKWIKDYCMRCNKCIKACPEKALTENNDILAKTNIDDAKCIGCSQGCTYCIEACPFFEKGYDYVKKKQTKIETKLKKIK